jgi:hypothetical protein
VPAAAVIPAPIAYIKVVAVKKLVVGFTASAVSVRRSVLFGLSSVLVELRLRTVQRDGRRRARLLRQKSRAVSEVQNLEHCSDLPTIVALAHVSSFVSLIGCEARQDRRRITLKKLECSKRARRFCAAYRSNRSAWNDGRGPRFYSVRSIGLVVMIDRD